MDNDRRGLKSYRERIDWIDDALLLLLCERARVATEIGGIKRRNGKPIRSLERERIVLERAIRRSAGVLPPAAVKRLYRAIMSESRAVQKHAETTMEDSHA